MLSFLPMPLNGLERLPSMALVRGDSRVIAHSRVSLCMSYGVALLVRRPDEQGIA